MLDPHGQQGIHKQIDTGQKETKSLAFMCRRFQKMLHPRANNAAADEDAQSVLVLKGQMQAC